MTKTDKVLYIGYYKENSDWGKFATNNILALESAGIDVACRPIVFSNNETPNKLKHLEKKSIVDCNICIQHVFPEHMVSSQKFKKNIALLANEFINIDHSTWVEKLDRMDRVWVPSDTAKEYLKNTSLYNKIDVVPFAFDIDVYTKQYEQLQGGIETADKFRFYTISDLNNSDLDRVIKCFYSEFSHTDKTVLVIQINDNNPDGLDDKITTIKSKLGLEKEPHLYNKVVIVTRQNASDSYNQIHTFCDCYVSSLRQRSLNGEEFSAMAFGNTPIIAKHTDAVYYMGDKYAVDAIYNVNMSHSQMWPDANNGKDYTLTPCELQTKAMMRKLYNKWTENPVTYKLEKRQQAFKIMQNFSTESVGNIMKEIIYA